MGLLSWLKKLFRKREDKLTKEEIRDVEDSTDEIRRGETKRFTNTDDFLKELKEERIERAKRFAIARKDLKINKIREANVQHRKDTLGYSLRGKFKPRPYEKRLYQLEKKPDADKD